MATVDDDLAGILEHHGNPLPDPRLNLPDAPFRALGMTNEHAGFEELVHPAPTGQEKRTDMDGTRDITSLIGSRICHDLISPLGAIGNGVELLSLSGGAEGPEVALIAESVENANARIRFFRVAFGTVRPGSEIDHVELAAILDGFSRAGRSQVFWEPRGPVQRQVAKLVFLCLQCLETAMPWGGRVLISPRGRGWQLAAEGPKVRPLPQLWEVFDDPALPHDVAPAELQFDLAPRWAARIRHRLERDESETTITLRLLPY